MVLHAHDQLAAARTAYQRASLLDPKAFDWLYYQGASSTGADAVAPLRRALDVRDYLPAKIRLSEALLAAGDSPAAAGVLRGIDHPVALFVYGRAAGDPKYFEKAIEKFPQYGGAMFALAQHYQRTGRAADASRLMEQYAKFKTVVPPIDDPLMDAVYALNQGATALLRQAMSLEQAGRLAEAAALNERALELDPTMIQAHINLLSAYGRLDRFDDAEAHYRAAVAINSSDPEAHYNFGVLCYQTGRMPQAQRAFEQAIAADPNYVDAHNNLGVILEREGRIADAAKHFARAVELRPSHRLARFHLGRIYANQRNYPAAITQFREIVTVDDESTPGYLYALGATYARSGDRAAARSTLSAAYEKASAQGQSQLADSIRRDLSRLQQ